MHVVGKANVIAASQSYRNLPKKKSIRLPDRTITLSSRRMRICQTSGVQKRSTHKTKWIRLRLAKRSWKVLNYSLGGFGWIDGSLQVAVELICRHTHDRLLIEGFDFGDTNYPAPPISLFTWFQFIELDDKNRQQSSFINQINLRLEWEATLNCVRPAWSSISIDARRSKVADLAGLCIVAAMSLSFQ